jgi:malate dehydrogenase (oxaloacetate-decarboxylating)(NADP+)
MTPSHGAHLSAAERAVIARLGEEVSFAAGERILEEGAAGDGFYVVQSGLVEVRKGGRPIAELGDGAVLGEMAIFGENVRAAEAVAVEPSRLLHVPTEEFVGLVLRGEPAAVEAMQALGQLMVGRLQELDAELGRWTDGLVAQATSGDSAGAPEEFAAMRKGLLADWALRYHALGKPGKLSVVSSKAVGTAADLSVAYSPGVAEPCLAIRDEPDRAYEYTGRGHLVGVVTNGTAVLGLGDIGALASKPVMEGKAVLFKRFADVDAFDVEVDEADPERFVEIVCAIAPTFGGINLEDIRAPECFFIEAECKRRCEIPVFHDDQHGTAIIAGAGLLNALELVGKPIGDVSVVFSGAGAAGFACARYFLQLGVRRDRLVLTDVNGVVYRGRGDGNYLDELAAETDARTLAEAVAGTDVFVGVSAPNVLTAEMLLTMARDPVVFALANPVPEIDYRLARQTRGDVILATGRSDYPNQINNVIAFPHIFRGALDTRARAIDEHMKLAATHAIASLAKEQPGYGRDAVIPKPFDRRLLSSVAPAVAEAAMRSGAARLSVDLDEYRERLARMIS